MSTLIFSRAIGRISTLIDRIYYAFSKASNREGEFDRTGIVAGDARPLPVVTRGDVLWAEYESIGFSLWRAQELSLFKQHLGAPQRPVADIGCGDGSFASVLFREIDYGIDHDPAALNAAERRGIYKNLFSSTEAIESGSLRSVYANSVLEHIKGLEAALAEIARITAPGGVFAFTVPVANFARHLSMYFGRWYSDFINRSSSHVNLFTPEQWRKLVEAHGFSVVLVRYYQPAWFTYRYTMLRFLSENGLGRILPGIGKKVFRRRRDAYLEMVRRSLDEPKDGANIFLLAVRQESGKAAGHPA